MRGRGRKCVGDSLESCHKVCVRRGKRGGGGVCVCGCGCDCVGVSVPVGVCVWV